MIANLPKPDIRPDNSHFSSGPCAKRPNWSVEHLSNAWLGRSHRAQGGKDKLKQAIEDTLELLRVPDTHRIGIVPASDTGAVELALWNLLGQRGVDLVAWESFGFEWCTDVKSQLQLDDVREIRADYGKLPDLTTIDFGRDVVFTWNGTTSGVRVPDGEFIPDDRQGLTICDATSAAFAQDLPFSKLDVVTFSWQKVLGSEAAHGVIILSPRAVERLENYTPPRPLPKIFRLTKGGKLINGIFEGATINTPSMLCVEDYLDALGWAKSIGGLEALFERANRNFSVLNDFVDRTDWLGFLATDPATRSNTSVCLVIQHPEILALDVADQSAFAKSLAKRLEDEAVAYDIGAYRNAPPGLRIWTGATIETSDIEALMPWLDWAFNCELAALKS